MVVLVEEIKRGRFNGVGRRDKELDLVVLVEEIEGEIWWSW